MIRDNITNVTLRNRNIILSITIRIRQQKVVIIIISSILKSKFISIISSSQGAYKRKTNQLIFISGNIWNIDFMGARNNFLIFFTRENIDANEMNLGMSVFAGVGCRHVDNFAGTVFHHHIAVLSQR